MPNPGYVDAVNAFNAVLIRMPAGWHKKALELAERAWKQLSDPSSGCLPHERATGAAALAAVLAANDWKKLAETARERIDRLVAEALELQPAVRNEADRTEAAKAWKVMLSMLATLEASRGRRNAAEAYLARSL